uniref:Bulb-type lectin domain-containing protein n=1 Tax=Macrostomum lignano TaxID=282301 RepID=A0A1I8FDS7_9PLAT
MHIRDEMMQNGVKFLWNENVASVTRTPPLLPLRRSAPAAGSPEAAAPPSKASARLIWADGPVAQYRLAWLAADGAGIALDSAGNVRWTSFRTPTCPASTLSATWPTRPADRPVANRGWAASGRPAVRGQAKPSWITATSQEAVKKHGEKNLKIYAARRLPGRCTSPWRHKPRFRIKLICLLPPSESSGCTCSVKARPTRFCRASLLPCGMGATKADFDNTAGHSSTSARGAGHDALKSSLDSGLGAWRDAELSI